MFYTQVSAFDLMNILENLRHLEIRDHEKNMRFQICRSFANEYVVSAIGVDTDADGLFTVWDRQMGVEVLEKQFIR